MAITLPVTLPVTPPATLSSALPSTLAIAPLTDSSSGASGLLAQAANPASAGLGGAAASTQGGLQRLGLPHLLKLLPLDVGHLLVQRSDCGRSGLRAGAFSVGRKCGDSRTNGLSRGAVGDRVLPAAAAEPQDDGERDSNRNSAPAASPGNDRDRER